MHGRFTRARCSTASGIVDDIKMFFFYLLLFLYKHNKFIEVGKKKQHVCLTAREPAIMISTDKVELNNTIYITST